MFQYNSKTLFSRANTGIKMIFTLTAMAVSLVVSDLWMQAGLLMVVAALVVIAPFRDYKKLLQILVPFLLLTNLSLYIILMMRPGALDAMALVSLRFTNIFLVFTWFMYTTNLFSLVELMRKMRSPESLTLGLYITLRFFPELEREFGNILQMQRLKGITIRRPARFVKAHLLPLFYTAFDRADELAIAYYLREKNRKNSCNILENGG